ncbi:MAG: transglycosylase domain-containing protein, partial [Gammaproteobacteria bacterium]|nr:transglycosylase domain-containing protein [Gammaproteobacteria bacterium]
MSPLLKKTLGFIPAALYTLLTLGVVALAGAYLYIAPQLPATDQLTEVRLQVPLKVYTREGKLIAEFGEIRRIPVRLSQVPKQLAQAVLAAEDDRFYSHPGVDYQGLLRAAFTLAATGEKKQGGSTITMQVARNFFLSSEKTFLRKLKEILLAFRIEQSLSKDQILELYLNKIYCGNRAYGVAAAAQFYYGAELNQLTLAQMAALAGLPKAPSKYNPLVNLERAVERRNYILERMVSLGYISETEYQTARSAPETAARHNPEIEVEAPHVAEMVRAEMVRRYGEAEAYTGGYEVYTTLDAHQQTAANQSLRAALLEYDQRHGYRKPEGRVEMKKDASSADWQAALEGYSESGGLLPALVLEARGQTARAYTPGEGVVNLTWAGLAWAAPYINENRIGP